MERLPTQRPYATDADVDKLRAILVQYGKTNGQRKLQRYVDAMWAAAKRNRMGGPDGVVNTGGLFLRIPGGSRVFTESTLMGLNLTSLSHTPHWVRNPTNPPKRLHTKSPPVFPPERRTLIGKQRPDPYNQIADPQHCALPRHLQPVGWQG